MQYWEITRREKNRDFSVIWEMSSILLNVRKIQRNAFKPASKATAEYANEYYDDDADEEGDYYEEMVEEIALEEELEDALADLMVERQSLLRREKALTRNIEAGMAIVDKKHLQQRLLYG